jgi:2-methylcitrate dehydratase
MDAFVEQLVAHALDPRWESLPIAILHECKRRIIDTLGCAIAAYHAEPSRIARELGMRVAASPGARVLGTRHSTLPELATFANGVMGRYLDGNDCFPGGGGHPSDIISPVLALANARAIDAKTSMAAIALGYDIHFALFRALRMFEQGFDHPFYTAIATAVVSAKLLGGGAEQIGQAISLAMTPNLSLGVTRRGRLSMWKGVASANASRNGMFAALLAQAGMTGPDRPFEGALGLKHVVPETIAPSLTNKDVPYRILQADTKFFVTEFHSEAPIMLALRLGNGLKVDDIEAVEISTYRFAYEEIGSGPEKWRPQTRETADHSMPYIVASVLARGEFADDIFAPARFKDERTLAVADRISIQEDDLLSRRVPACFPCRMTIRMRDGEIKSDEMSYPRGHHLDPMSDSEVSSKFTHLANRALEPVRVERALEGLWSFDRLASVGALFDHLVVSSA